MSKSQLSGAKDGSRHGAFQPTSEPKDLLINTAVHFFPGLRSGSGGCLQRPARRRSIAERPEPAGGALGTRWGGEGRGRARTFDPGGPAAGRVWGLRGAAREEGEGGWVERTGAASIWGEIERGGEERERGRGEPEGAVQ